MTRDRLGSLAALAGGAALVGIGACSNNETPVQAPSSPIASGAPATLDAGAAMPMDDAGPVDPALAAQDGGIGARWRHHGTPNAMPPRLLGKPPVDAGP